MPLLLFWAFSNSRSLFISIKYLPFHRFAHICSHLFSKVNAFVESASKKDRSTYSQKHTISNECAICNYTLLVPSSFIMSSSSIDRCQPYDFNSLFISINEINISMVTTRMKSNSHSAYVRFELIYGSSQPEITFSAFISQYRIADFSFYFPQFIKKIRAHSCWSSWNVTIYGYENIVYDSYMCSCPAMWNIFREYFSCCFTSQHLFPFINVLILARMTRIFTSKCHEISRVRSFIAEVNKWVYAWNFCVGGQSQRNECLWLVNSNRHNSGCPKNTCIKNKTHNTQQDARKQNRWASTKKNSNTQRAVYKTLDFDACVLLTEWIWLLWQR